MSDAVWCVLPVLASPEMTEAAIGDLLAQTVPTRILIVNQGVETAFRQRLERIAEEYPDRVFCWHHNPPLPSLSATWNRALRFVWETGGSEALVVNNDVRLQRDTIPFLYDGIEMRYQLQQKHPLFITAVGVTAEQFEAFEYDVTSYGGPDFSCFLISKEGHEKYPFDEAFIPAFAEDLDMHRRYMLGGDGDKIFSINLPFHHVGAGSQTLKSMTPEARTAWEARINAGSRAHYRAKWGGDVNAERYTIPFDPTSAQDNVTTPDLQRAIQHGTRTPV